MQSTPKMKRTRITPLGKHEPVGLTKLLEEGWILTPAKLTAVERERAITNALSSPEYRPSQILLYEGLDLPADLQGKVRFGPPQSKTVGI